MSTSGLPASRGEALSVIVLGVVSSLLGETPSNHAAFGIIFTGVANAWAIASSILTLMEFFSSDYRIEFYLQLFMLGLLAQTVVTSVCALLLLMLPCLANTGFGNYLKYLGLTVIALTLILDLLFLYLSYSEGCSDDDFHGARCEHSSNYVLAAVISAGVVAVLISCLIIKNTDSKSHSVIKHLIDPLCSDVPHSEGTAILTRTSAFVKVCLLSVYWFLVDADMTWDFFMGHDASWWMTGQWAKQGVPIANTFLNNSSCCYHSRTSVNDDGVLITGHSTRVTSDFQADGDAPRPQRPAPRLTKERPAAIAIPSRSCQLTPSFPQSEPLFLTLGMPHPALVRVPMAYNISTASSPLSSSSSPAADGVDPTQPWVELMRTSRQEKNEENGDFCAQVTRKKRGAQEERGQGGSDGQKRPKRKRKYRKATHTVRKEEKEKLLTEMEVLKAQIANLRNHVRAPVNESEEGLKTEYETGRILRESVQERQQVFSKISSIMSEYTLCTIQSGSPLQDFIHLKNDEQSRHETLAAIKRSKMETAQRFMRMRRPNLDPCNLMGEERRYEAENGDFCSTRFTVTQFEDAQSVKQVFDLLLFYFCNIEISISEKIGHITIREDDGGDDKGIVQNRLVSITHKDVKMESNTVMFSQFYDRSTDGRGESNYGLIVADFVDEDDRHPYVPRQRVRRDVNAVLEIREFVPQHPKCIAGGPASRKPVVVLSRWVQNRIHYPSFPVCTDGWYELRDNMDLWGRALHRTVAENLRAHP